MTAITFIGFGEAGGILAGDLARENDVTIWDHKLQGAERAAMREKAHLAGVRLRTRLPRRWRGSADLLHRDRRLGAGSRAGRQPNTYAKASFSSI